MSLGRYAGLSDRGRVRGTNDDRWIADPKHQFFLVTDGMGGHSAGGLAAHVIVETLPDKLRKVLATSDDLADPATVDRLAMTILQLGEEIRRESKNRPGFDGMGATVVLAVVRRSRALVLHLGDSRAYLVRRGRLHRLTKDHTLLQTLLENRVVSPDEVAGHPARGQLTRWVGMPNQLSPEARVVTLHPNDQILLCTDGLSGMVDDAQLQGIFVREADPGRACRRMVDAANDAGGNDNITALIITASEVPVTFDP